MFTKIKDNDYFLAVEIHQGETVYAKLGSMVSFQGNLKFEKVMLTSNDGGMFKNVMTTLVKGVAGESMDLMKIFGEGIVYLAHEATYILEIDMNQKGWNQLTVEGNKVLAYSEGVHHKVKMSTFGTSSTKGLFTSFFTAKTSNAHIALLSQGKPIYLPTPCSVDPQALVGYTGPPPKLIGNHFTWKTMIGQTSGETFVLDFTEPGHFVIIQPSELIFR